MHAALHDSAMSSTLHSAAAAPAALSAFLRGAERRAAVFAELQCGQAEAADLALAVAMRAFRNHAAALPMAEWPQRFWMLLVAVPALRQAAPGAIWPAPLGGFAALQPVPRQALVLRLAAGLEEQAAAAVMGLDLAGYREALACACPRDADGEPDPAAWRNTAESIQNTLRNLPPDRLARLARIREAAIEGSVPMPAQDTTGASASAAKHAVVRSAPMAPRAARRLLVAMVLVIVTLALAATWYWPRHGEEATGALAWGDPGIVIEALPESEPAARFNDAQALRSHPDLALIRDPEEPTLVAQADFLAWYSASIEVSPEAIAEPVGEVQVQVPPVAVDAPR